MIAPRPYTLVAELTYACPLRCAYCSNPPELEAVDAPLSTADWSSVLAQAQRLGVVQTHFTGGEPLLFRDLEVLVARAHSAELYSSLITSGVPATRERLADLARAGLIHVQLSLQGMDGSTARELAGVDHLEHKLRVADWVKSLDLALTLNVVLTRQNIEQVDDLIRLALDLGAARLELAHTQYLGWAYLNRAELMPDATSLERCRALIFAAKQRWAGQLEISSALPDYHTGQARACMEGWGRRYLVVSPDGKLLPCHAARSIRGLRFDDVRSAPLAELWARSEALQRFRGDGWLQAPCNDCQHRERDYGGCRCQAYLTTGDAAAPDPACQLTPAHALVRGARAARFVASPLRLRRAPVPFASAKR